MGTASRRKSGARSMGVRDRAAQVIERMSGAKEVRFRRNQPQEQKISGALSTLLEFEVAEGSPLAEYKAVLDFIVIAWNISLMNADERSDALRKFVATPDGADDAMRRAALGHLERPVARKLALFPHDQRTVVAWDVWFQGNSVRVSAAAMSPPE